MKNIRNKGRKMESKKLNLNNEGKTKDVSVGSMSACGFRDQSSHPAMEIIYVRGLHSRMPFPGNRIFPEKIWEIYRPQHSGVYLPDFSRIFSIDETRKQQSCPGTANSGNEFQSRLVLSRLKRARERRPLNFGNCVYCVPQ